MAGIGLAHESLRGASPDPPAASPPAPESAVDLLEAAAHKSSAEIRLLLAERFPQPDLATSFEPLGRGVAAQDAPGQVDEQPGPRAKVVPLSSQRYALQVTLGQGAHDKLCYAKALLGHAGPSVEVAEVLDRALDALIEQFECRRFASTARSRPGRRGGQVLRHGRDPAGSLAARRRPVH